MSDIKRVVVLGAGTMGTGIAGVAANAGCDVLLLDMEKEACEQARQRLVAGRSPVVAEASVLERIETGSFDEDLARIADYDWICEVVVEDLEIKRRLMERVEAARADGSVVSTNTSGIPLRDISEGLPKRLRHDIAVTHFFNPVHIMKLVELVAGEDTDPRTVDRLAGFLGTTLDKGVVYAKDTVNFIGNRIGCFWMLAGLHLADRAMTVDGLSLEEIDALMSEPVGLPATGLYGLIDLVGLDVMFNVARNLETNLPNADLGRKYLSFPEPVQRLHDRGQLGRKTGGGFYRLNRHEDGSKSMDVFDLEKDDWRPHRPVELAEGERTLEELFDNDSPRGRFVRDMVLTTIRYAADLVPEIANDIVNIDRAMRWGFGWQQGPFELVDRIGAARLIDRYQQDATPVPKMLRVLDDMGETHLYRSDGREFLTWQGLWETVSD